MVNTINNNQCINSLELDIYSQLIFYYKILIIIINQNYIQAKHDWRQTQSYQLMK